MDLIEFKKCFEGALCFTQRKFEENRPCRAIFDKIKSIIDDSFTNLTRTLKHLQEPKNRSSLNFYKYFSALSLHFRTMENSIQIYNASSKYKSNLHAITEESCKSWKVFISSFRLFSDKFNALSS